MHIHEKETKIIHCTLQYLKPINNTTKDDTMGAKDYDYPMTLRRKKNRYIEERKIEITKDKERETKITYNHLLLLAKH